MPLWVADMDFRAPPAVIDALRQRVDHGVFGYTLAGEALTAAVVSHVAAAYAWTVSPEWLVWLPGLVTGLNVACRATGAPGDAVLAATPVYPPFLSAPGHAQRQLVTTPLVRTADGWTFDWAHLARAITPRARLFLLCNPHNPVGRVFRRDELAALAALCGQRDLVICSDEIHCGLPLDADKPHLPIAALGPEIAARTITLMAPSKTFNIPGLGCAFAIISDPDLRRRFRQAMAGIVPEVNTLGYTAALAAYRDGEPWRQALLAYLRGNRALVAEAIAAMPGLSMTPVEAGYLAWIDARGAGLAQPTAFFEAAGVGLSDGAAFGAPGFVRLNFGCPRPLLREALTRMARAMARPHATIEKEC